MKKILFILAFVYTAFSYGQGGPKVDAIRFKGDVTTTVRDAIDVPAGETWLIYNVTTDKVEFASSDDVWHDLTQLPLIDDNNLTTATSTNVASASSVKNYVDFYAVELTGGVNVNRSADFGVMDTATGVSGFIIDGGSDRAQISGGTVGSQVNLYVGSNGVYSLDQSNAVIDAFGDYAFTTKLYNDTNYISQDSIVDSDTFASVSPTTVPSSESVKAYVDANVGGGASLPVDDTTSLVQDPVDGTKEMRIDVGAVSTSTVRTLTMPDADVDLGNLGAANLDLTDAFDWTGLHSFSTQLTMENASVRWNNATSTDYWIHNISVASESPTYVYQSFDGGVFNAQYTLNFSGVPANATDLVDKAYVDGLTHTDDQTASEVNITDSGANYTGTTVEAALTEIADSLAVQITSDITGVTGGTAIKNMYLQTEAGQDTDGTPPAGVASLCIDCSPAKVVATATIAMDGWKMYDDQTADAATITLSDCDPGETLTVYINRASAPTLAGTGLTFNQLPNTTAFASATQMMIIFEVAYDGTTIDYYYVER